MKRNVPLEEARIRRLLAVGCPVPDENGSTRAPDLVVEVRNPERNQAFDFRFSTEYILDVTIKNISFVKLKSGESPGHPPLERQESHLAR